MLAAWLFGTVLLSVSTASAAVCIVWQVVLKPLPFQDPERLLVAGKVSLTEPQDRPSPISVAEFLDWRERVEGLDFAGFRTDLLDVREPGTALARTRSAVLTTGDLFDVLGLPVQLGRGLGPNDAERDDGCAAVLSDGYWRTAFGGEPGVVGSVLAVSAFDSSRSCTVVGVLARGVQILYPVAPDIYLPWRMLDTGRSGTQRRGLTVHVVARMKDGVTTAAAERALKSVVGTLNREYPESVQARTAAVMPIADYELGSAWPLLRAAALSAVLLVLLASVNLSGLLFADIADRRAEIAVRYALGATRWRIAVDLALEAFAVVGSAVSLSWPVSAGLLGVFRSTAPATLPRAQEVAFNPVALGAVGAPLLLCVALAAWWGGSQRASTDASTIRAGERHAGPDRLGFVTNTTHVTVCLCFVFAATLMVQSVMHLRSVPLGFSPAGVVALRTRFGAAEYGPQGVDIQARIRRAILRLPGVTQAGWSSDLPLAPAPRMGVELEPGSTNFIGYRFVDPAYLDLLGSRVVAGRRLTIRDSSAVLINETLARQLGGTTAALGRFIRLDRPFSIVGVIADIHETPLSALASPVVYVPFNREHWMSGAPWILVRTGRSDPRIVQAIETEIASADPTLAIVATESLASYVARARRPTVFASGVLLAFAFTAVIVTSVGLLGFGSRLVIRNLRAFAIRQALGASRTRVGLGVVWLVMRVWLTGTLVGMLACWLGAPLIRSLLFSVNVRSLTGYAIAAAVMMAVGIGAALGPAFRAARINPARILAADR